MPSATAFVRSRRRYHRETHIQPRCKSIALSRLGYLRRRYPRLIVEEHISGPATSTHYVVREEDSVSPQPVRIRLRVPRMLERPSFVEVSREVLDDAFEEPLPSDIPADFVRDIFKEIGPRILHTCVSTTVIYRRRSPIREKLQVIIRDQDAETLPTHIFAVYGLKSTLNLSLNVKLFPIYAPLVAAHCANLPLFGPGLLVRNNLSIPTSRDGSRIYTLPVRTIRAPHPETFSIVMQYLHTRSVEDLYYVFLPCEVEQSIEAFEDVGLSERLPYDDAPQFHITHRQKQLAEALVATTTVQELLVSLNRITGAWKNVRGLGIHDDDLWDTIHGSWAILLHALALIEGVEFELKD